MTRAMPTVIAVVLLAMVLAPATDAHKGITSKYTYNAEVYPVLLNRCGRCHIDGGVGPMSLLKYEAAFPWAESLRAELLTAYPGVPADLSADLSVEARSANAEAQSATVDPHDFVKAAHRQILARELDIVLDWATGGTPEGDKAQTPPETSLRIDWASGHPDLVAQMPNRYHMNVTALDATHETALPIPTPSPVTVDRLDLLPGNPAIIRSAVLSLRSPDGTTRMLGTWVPRQVPAAIVLKPPVRIDPGSQIVARIQYKKTWKYEGQEMSDLSLVGLYVGD
ncbi:MAG TPA: hypothetical protein VGC23_05955 [Vicinamibacterales bacterium]